MKNIKAYKNVKHETCKYYTNSKMNTAKQLA